MDKYLDCDIRDLPGFLQEDKHSKTKELFSECESIIDDRISDYGEASESFSRIARLWSAYIDTTISSKDVAMMLTLFKIAREQGNPKRDNIVDGINYLALSEML